MLDIPIGKLYMYIYMYVSPGFLISQLTYSSVEIFFNLFEKKNDTLSRDQWDKKLCISLGAVRKQAINSMRLNDAYMFASKLTQ